MAGGLAFLGIPLARLVNPLQLAAIAHLQAANHMLERAADGPSCSLRGRKALAAPAAVVTPDTRAHAPEARCVCIPSALSDREWVHLLAEIDVAVGEGDDNGLPLGFAGRDAPHAGSG